LKKRFRKQLEFKLDDLQRNSTKLIDDPEKLGVIRVLCNSFEINETIGVSALQGDKLLETLARQEF
jgi:hypothetical protein